MVARIQSYMAYRPKRKIEKGIKYASNGLAAYRNIVPGTLYEQVDVFFKFDSGIIDNDSVLNSSGHRFNPFIAVIGIPSSC